MREYIAFDSHKRYTLAEVEDVETGRARVQRVEHARGAIRRFLEGCGCEPGTPVAVEATGNWYWIVQEIEQARHSPRLVHPRKAKLMMGMINKTDRLDVHGLNRLQRNGTLPEVWIPPAGLRDLRELTRTRMVLARHRAALKNRLQATLAKYALAVEGCSDAFGAGGRGQVEKLLEELPEQTRWSSRALLDQLDFTQKQLDEQEGRLRGLLETTPEMRRLKTLPGVGVILCGVIALEVGDVKRFASAERLASYAGTTPRVSSSGDRARYGRVRADVNRYLKWAFAEAANVVALNHKRWRGRHAAELYRRLKEKKGHAKAAGAVARHLAEASWHVLSGEQDYRDPGLGRTTAGRATGRASGV